jgi:hypothetical protein
MTVWPERSSTSAPAGTRTEPAGPTATMRSPSMTTVWPVRAGAPVPSITFTLVSATTGASTATRSRNCSGARGLRREPAPRGVAPSGQATSRPGPSKTEPAASSCAS